MPLDFAWEKFLGDRVAGMDEAGRGPWAGPVAAAAVILEPGDAPQGLADSKMLSAKRRRALADQIRTRATAWAVGWATVAEIDAHNIRRATGLAMARAVRRLPVRPRRLLIDGRDVWEFGSAAMALPKGDTLSASVAAASILAKTARDAFMARLATRYRGYGWETNMGYGAPAHQEALRRLGVTPHHRRSFRPVAAALTLESR